jgi:2'-5' RNA ligase
METPPLILTLSLEETAAHYFTAVRTKHFPAERNYLQAHLTLFHHLPSGEEQLLATLTQISLAQAPLELQVTGIMGLGRGVAYKLESEELQQLHARLQQEWQPFLIPQDRQRLRPHITVQNKVAPETAKALEQELKATFSPFTVKGTGFSLWKYLGGPWELYQSFRFR